MLLADYQNFWTRLGVNNLEYLYCLIVTSVHHQLSHNQRLIYSLPSTQNLQETVRAFKSSLKVSPEKAREIECNTRQQRLSQLWFDLRRYRITASMFGHVLSRRVDTPDNLVLRIIEPKTFSTPATRYGIENEQVALEKYTTYQRNNGHPHITVSPSGVQNTLTLGLHQMVLFMTRQTCSNHLDSWKLSVHIQAEH
jgi:hypothetical protein